MSQLFGYYACKYCLKNGCDTCCGERKCNKKSSRNCCVLLVLWPCICLFFNLVNRFDLNDPHFCYCCCCCPKEGKVEIYCEK